MSFESLLVHRATIMRRTPGAGVDEHGGDTDAFAAIANDVPCRKYTSPSVREREQTDAAGTFRRSLVTIDFKFGTDVTAKDRVVIDGITWNVLSVDEIAVHHLSASAEVVNG